MWFKKKKAVQEEAPTPKAEKAPAKRPAKKTAPKEDQTTEQLPLALQPKPPTPPTLDELADDLELASLSATPMEIVKQVAKDLRELAAKQPANKKVAKKRVPAKKTPAKKATKKS